MMRRQSGFTLLELLIALALVGLLTVLLFAGLRLGSDAWDRTEDSMDRSGNVRLVWQFLQNHLQQARTVLIGLDGLNNTQAIFSGLEDGLEFVSYMTAGLGAGGVYVLRLEPIQGERKQLLLSRWLYHPEVLQGVEALPIWKPLSAGNLGDRRDEDPELTAYYSESLLLDELETLEIRYFGADPGQSKRAKNATAQWHDQWLNRKELPWLVAIRIHDGRDQWPEMIFSLPH